MGKFRHIICVFLFLVQPLLTGASYYVRTDGHDTNCNGSADVADSAGVRPSCAFLTVNKGITSGTSPGDFINIRGDHSADWLQTTAAHGCTGAGCTTSPTYITIQTTPGAAQYSGIISPGIRVDHNYIIVRDLGIVGASGASSGFAGVTFGWSASANYGKALNNHFYNPSSPIGSTAVLFSTGSDNIAEGNLIEGDTNPSLVSGHHTGANGKTLVDSEYTWTTNQWQGRKVWNISANIGQRGTVAGGTVVSNDTNSLTTSANIDWVTNDCYTIGTSFWIPIIFTAAGNTSKDNIIRNLVNSERIYDTISSGTLISGDEVSNAIYGNELVTGGARAGVFDNCEAHTDIFQQVSGTSDGVIIENSYFHDLQSQTGITEGTTTNWIIRNNIFANITQRQTIGGPGFQWYNNIFWNVAQGDQLNPLEGWTTGEEYKNNVIIGGSTNAAYGIIGATTMGTMVKCADEGEDCTFTGTKDLIFINSGGTVNAIWKRNVTSPQACTIANFGSDPNQYYSKSCYMKDHDEVPATNNFYSTLSYGARTESAILFSGDTNFINGGDPKFVAAYTDCVNNTCDFHLQSDSPLKTAGADLSSVWSTPTDKDGVARTGWSIGAYEYDDEEADTTDPTVTAFTIPSTAESLTVAISSFTCEDETALAASPYCVTTTNSSSGCSWVASAPSSVTFSAEGAQTAYAWCKDAADNISDFVSDTVTITLPAAGVSVMGSGLIMGPGVTIH